MHKISVSILSLAMAFTAHAQTQLYDWNAAGSVASFNNDNSNFSQGVSNGLNSTDSLTFGGGDISFTMTTPDDAVAFDLSTDQTITQSTFFQVGSRTTFGRNNRYGVMLGLTEASNATLASNPFTTSESIEGGIYINAYDDGGAGTHANASFASLGSVPTSGNIDSATFHLDFGNWYFMEVQYDYSNGSDNWTISYTLNNSDATGSIGSLVASASTNVQTNGFGSSPDLRGFIYSQGGDRTNISVLDNTSLVAIPEPSTSAALISAGVFGLLAARRRH